jgi:acid phosphatase type 7
MNLGHDVKTGYRAILGSLALFSLLSCGGGSSPSVTSSPSTATLFAVGDIAQCGSLPAVQALANQTLALVTSLQSQTKTPGNVLTLGDNVYNTGTAAEFLNCYDPTWGQLKSVTWATPGNHDYGTPDAGGYFDYFGASAGPDRKGYYSKTVNGWLVVSLNSNVDSTASSAQYKWLQSQLSAVTEGCILAVWHHPMFTSATRGDDRKMTDVYDLLVAKKADLILQGHEHHFERFQPMLSDGTVDVTRGLVSMVVGTGGASLNDFSAKIHSGSQSRIKELGVLQMELAVGSLTWKFVNVAQKALDSGSISCKVKT